MGESGSSSYCLVGTRKKREDRCRFVWFGVGVEQEKRPSNVRVDSQAVGTANQHTRHRILITLMLLLQLR